MVSGELVQIGGATGSSDGAGKGDFLKYPEALKPFGLEEKLYSGGGQQTHHRHARKEFCIFQRTPFNA